MHRVSPDYLSRDLGQSPDLDSCQVTNLVANLHLCEGEVEILLCHCLVHLVFNKVLHRSAEVGIHAVIFLGDGLGQHAVVSLDVPHGDLQRVPLWLDQLLGRFQVFRLVPLVPPLLQEVLEPLLASLSNLVPDMPCLYLCCSNIHCRVSCRSESSNYK